MSKANPELLEQLDNAGSALVQAIFQLNTGYTAIVDRCELHFGYPVRCNLLKNLAILVVEGKAELIRWLIEQPEVTSAIANKTKESLFIQPVDTK